MNCQWVIDTVLLERHDDGFGFPRIEEAAKQLGHDVYITKYIPFSDMPEFDFNLLDPGKPTILYGSIQFLNQVKRWRMSLPMPGTYFKTEELRYSNYSPIYGDLMLNDRYIMLPYGEVKRRLHWDLDYALQPPYFESPKMFIRPDAVTKSFAGRVIDFASENENPSALSQYEKILDHELCILAPETEIIGEYRHIICNRKVIAQSQYRRDGKLDIRIDVEPECQRLAEEVAKRDYQPDTVYTLDTAWTPDGPRIVEFNAFSCSGLYACDTIEIVKKVSEEAIREFKGWDLND